MTLRGWNFHSRASGDTDLSVNPILFSRYVGSSERAAAATRNLDKYIFLFERKRFNFQAVSDSSVHGVAPVLAAFLKIRAFL